MNATISIDSELKEQAEMFLGNYGMSLSDTVTNIVSRIIGNTNLGTQRRIPEDLNIYRCGDLKHVRMALCLPHFL